MNETLLPLKKNSSNPWIIDTDMAWDDWFAILYFLKSKEVSIQAIMVDNNGAATCKAPDYAGGKNVLRLMQLAGRTNIPVACSSQQRFSGKDYPEAFRQKMDDMFGIPLSTRHQKIASQSAEALWVSLLQSTSKKINILALGTLTSLAYVLDAHPELKNKIQAIYMMGGAIHVNGNVHKNAEWNIYADPRACEMVFASGVPIYLFPLDITNSVPVLYADNHQRIQKKTISPLSNFMTQVFSRLKQSIQRNSAFYWDPLVSVSVLNPEIIEQIKTEKIAVKLGPAQYSGQLIVADHGNSLQVVYAVDVTQFKKLFFEKLS